MSTFRTYVGMVACGVALAGCSTLWGYKSQIGANVYPATDWQKAKVLWSPPAAGAYEKIGMCFVVDGAAFITSGAYILRKAAADLGAGAAIVVMREGSSRASWASGSGSWKSYGGYVSARNWASDFPRNFGIAIKWSKS